MKLSIHLFICLVFFSVTSIFAQSETEKGIEFYKSGKYNEAINVLKNAAKGDSNNSQIWYFLGLSQLNESKLKDAEKSLQKSISINSNDALSHAGLAFVYLLKNNSEKAEGEATLSLNLNKNNSDAQYVLGVISFRNGFYNRSYDYAKNIVAQNPEAANAFLLKAESLISSFIQQTGTVMLPTNQKADLLKEAENDLDKYISLTPNRKDISFYKEYLESVKFFAKYYQNLDNKLPSNIDSSAQAVPNQTALKILTKPKANYTPEARQAGVSGTIRLLAGFSENGKINHVLILKPLGFGLDQEAVAAAKNIKFVPQTKDGKPISVVKTLEFTFKIN